MLLSAGISHWNAGNFFRTHDLLQESRPDPDGAEELIDQGLIHTAAGIAT